MGQPQHGWLAQTTPKKIAHTEVNSITRQLRWQGKIEPSSSPFGEQTIRQRESRLRLASPHRGFHQYDSGRIVKVGRLLLQF